MSYRKGLSLGALGITGIVLGMLMCLATAQADGLQEFVLSQLDGKGTVDSINTHDNRIVIGDRTYVMSRNTSVFDVSRKRNASVRDIKAGDMVGFRSRPLPKPTAPYDQSIVKLWILPSNN
jgi:hypothetical protein